MIAKEKFIAYLNESIDNICGDIANQMIEDFQLEENKKIHKIYKKNLFDILKKETINYFNNLETISIEEFYKSMNRLKKADNNLSEDDDENRIEFFKKEANLFVYAYMDDSDSKTEIKAMKSIISINKSYIDMLANNDLEEGDLFIQDDFRVISSIFKDSKLSVIEQFQVLIYLIEKDLKKFDYMNKAIEVMEYDGFELMQLPKEEQIKIVREKYLLDIICGKSNMTSLIENIDIIKSHYIDIKDTYDESDVNIVVSSLRNLQTDVKLCENIAYILKREISKRNRNNENIQRKTQVETMEDKFSKINNEKKKMREELDTYFDFRNMRVLRFLEMDEVLHVVSLLKKLKYDEETIKEFVRINRFEMNAQNPITKYVQLRQKLEYYEEKYGLSEELNTLDEYFKELFLASNEDYDFWKKSLQEELENVLKLVPNTYEYELKKI